jgi:hypothetical protein
MPAYAPDGRGVQVVEVVDPEPSPIPSPASIKTTAKRQKLLGASNRPLRVQRPRSPMASSAMARWEIRVLRREQKAGHHINIPVTHSNARIRELTK